jgi:hypothetical protein
VWVPRRSSGAATRTIGATASVTALTEGVDPHANVVSVSYANDSDNRCVQSRKGSPEWDLSMLEKAWGEEALTAAVMPRYHADVAIRRSLGAKLGSLKATSS